MKLRNCIFIIVIILISNIYVMSQEFDNETIILGSGCFWCSEAIFQRLEGVSQVESGYCGGDIKNPTYDQVCTGKTSHAEVVRVTYKPNVIGLSELLEVFFKTHDATTLNRQGADVGTQYRSVIFYNSDEQKKVALDIIKELNAKQIWDKPIVTQVVQMSTFYPAEKYHQNYFNDNKNQGYCRFVIVPKLEKFEKVFSDKFKKN